MTRGDDGEATVAAAEGAMAGNTVQKVEELTSMMKSFMQTQAARDKQQEKELSRQELRWQNMDHQFRQIQAQVTEMREERQAEQDGVAEQHRERSSDDDYQGETSRSRRRSPRLQRAPSIC